jgi:hypothetical protein
MHSFKEIATVRERNREGRTRRRATAGRILNTEQIVEKLRPFIKADKIILTWHVNAADLMILKDFLEANGYETASILPRKSNCVFMVPYFRRNLGKLSDGKLFQPKLGVLFPLLFPRNGLAS